MLALLLSLAAFLLAALGQGRRWRRDGVSGSAFDDTADDSVDDEVYEFAGPTIEVYLPSEGSESALAEAGAGRGGAARRRRLLVGRGSAAGRRPE